MTDLSTPFLTGAPVGGSFALTDHHGRDVTDAAYRGRFMLIYFGFTHCRAVCPRALARLSEALAALGELADRIQPLYITVDPDRDTPEAKVGTRSAAKLALYGRYRSGRARGFRCGHVLCGRVRHFCGCGPRPQ